MVARRATPFMAIAAIFAVQALAGAPAVVVFPLYLTVVLFIALHPNRLEAGVVAGMGALALLLSPLGSGGSASDIAGAILLAAVLAGLAVGTNELARQWRTAAAAAQLRIDEVAIRERRLRATVESAEVGLGLADLEGNLVQASDKLAATLGRSATDLIGSRIVELTAESDRAAIAGAIGMLRNGDVTRWNAEVNQVLRDGSKVPVGLFLARLPVSASAGPLLLVQVSDVSARRRAESLRDCIAAVRQVMVSSASTDNALPQVLRAVCEELGWSAAQEWVVDIERKTMRVGKSWNAGGAALEGFTHASRSVAVSRGAGPVGRAWQSGVLAAEHDLERATDYEPKTAAKLAGLKSVVAFPIVDDGDVVAVVELVSTKTRSPEDDEVAVLSNAGVEIGQFMRRADTAQALRRSEADHRAIFERSPIGIARISNGGDLLEANAALLHMLQHDEPTMRSTAWPGLLRAYDQTAARLRKPPFLAGMSEGNTLQVRAATGAGSWLWLQLTATSIPDSSGTPEHVLVMVEDVTAVRETSDRLAEALEAQRDANANLERIDKTKSEFLSIVSHEFRTALTGIQGFSELIRDGGLGADEARSYGGYIFNDADRVNRLIGDMLDLDRMESGRMTMRTADVDINDIVMEAISRAAPSAVSVEFKSDLDPRLPIVTGDRDRLIQVLSNLVNNAVKYSPEGGTVTLATGVDGSVALISVTDTGIGIPQDDIGHVFERFRRVRSGPAQSIPGTGLGLTIVKQIVEMHGGKIWVESAVGHGSSFHFTIPLSSESANALQVSHG